MRTMNFDAIAASAPLDRTASAVRDGSGDAWTPQKRTKVFHTDTPKLSPDAPGSSVGAEFEASIKGLRFGRFVVVGRSVVQNPKRGASWLCRCDCGQFENRKAKAMRSPLAGEDCCYQCMALRRLQKAKPTSRSADAARLDGIAQTMRTTA